MDYLRFFWGNKRLISFGFILTFFSSFGQTFLLSLYVPKILNEFELTNSFFGGLYAVATIGSSLILVYVGKLIDRTDLKKYTIYSSMLLMAACLMLAFSFNVFMIFLGLLGLRFAGQGLLSHISNTSISKFFDKTRGKALSITSLGYSTGEGLLPIIMSFIMIYTSWRNSMIFSAVIVAIILIPFVWVALSKESAKPIENDTKSDEPFSNKLLLKDKKFYLLALNSIVLPFLITGLFFYQSELAIYKNWTLEWLSFCFIGFALGRTLFSLVVGKLIDNYSAVRLLPIYLLPFLTGLILLLTIDHNYSGFIYLFLTGISVGAGSNISTAAIAEIYGTKYLGSVRSLFVTIMILGTASSPLLFGLILDYSLSFGVIILGGIIFTSIVILQSVQLSLKYRISLSTN